MLVSIQKNPPEVPRKAKGSPRIMTKAKVHHAALTLLTAPEAVGPSQRDWLFHSVIHDLRNPVAAISAAAQILMDHELEPPEIKRLAANIGRSTSRMHDLLADITHTFKGKQSLSQICNIRGAVAAAWQTAASATGNQAVEISLEVDEEIEVSFVRSRLEQVFFNLIVNAIEAMPEGGRLRVGAVNAGNVVLIDFEDTGPGIDSAIRGRLFEPFVTAGKATGLGLGLALSRQIVLDRGGDLWYENSAGARFVVCLRLAGS